MTEPAAVLNAAEALAAARVPAADARPAPGGAAAMAAINALLLLGVLALAWTPAVIFWAALALAPVALLIILGITLGWWL